MKKFKPTEFLIYTKSKKGITLTTLVIAIILILILAGVTIGIITNEDGIYEKAQKAVEEYANAAEREQNQLNDLFDFINDSASNSTIYRSYEIGQEVTVGGESFYVLAPSGIKESTVTLLAKYNLKSDIYDYATLDLEQAPDGLTESTYYFDLETEGWEEHEDDEDYNWYEDSNRRFYTGCCFAITEYWSEECDAYTAWDTKKFDINKIKGRATQDDAIGKARDYAKLKGGINGRLPTYEEIMALKDDYGDMIFGKANLYNNDPENKIYGLEYWLSSASPYDKDDCWFTKYRTYYVDGCNGDIYTEIHFLDHDCQGNHVGVRPVITVSKTLVS